MVASVFSALSPNFLLHVTCRLVRSKSAGGLSRPSFFFTSVMTKGLPSTAARASSAFFLSLYLPLSAVNTTSL